MVALLETAAAASAAVEQERPVSDDLSALPDATFVDVPCASRLLERLGERGWTDVERRAAEARRPAGTVPALGRALAELLVRAVDGDADGAGSVVLPTTLVRRGSA